MNMWRRRLIGFRMSCMCIMQGVRLLQQFRYFRLRTGLERDNCKRAEVGIELCSEDRKAARDTSGSSVFHQDHVVLSYDLLIPLIPHLTTNKFDNHITLLAFDDSLSRVITCHRQPKEKILKNRRKSSVVN